MGSAAPTLAELDASYIKVTRSTNLRDVPLPGSPEELSHSHCTDHMVTVRWTASNGWDTPEVKPFANLSIPPTASCLHYATECFEGMKVYRGQDGKLRLFRPDLNGERLDGSSKRASLPGFRFEELKHLIAKLMQIDGPRWLPKDQPGRFLYLRPTVIGNGTQLGVQTPKEALLFIIAVPWPDPSKKKQEEGAPHGLKLLASQPDTIRAWPGGFGYAKLGANYGPSLAAHGRAQALGFDQVLWLFGEDRKVTEAGASNFFVVWDNKETGKLELITAPLDSQLILPGVTRRSVLELARTHFAQPCGNLAPVEVVEREFTIADIEEAWKEGRIVESFVSGTAFFITPVKLIRNGNVDIDLLTAGAERAGYAAQIKSWLEAIMYGKDGQENHKWGFVIEDELEN
ncbi:branched-chain amino acid aminotransferase, cytosolic [Aspergillus aculeatinus CBS 121060]|uniref:Cytosolic branched-chain amino acid aminotransferase n=1 Tax=Aspergillus aculeatinus CBS 121060 TaxID=1448322 RepID=A0ACD1HLB4_9EURO|nr:cytosolic branched-chain amino acid aminotransferase [Aspergillus aculeatinus CBS 121060]RAH74390.1 cytosolic branched-chain amino acid aminotransferase [Aspergillus aculeatinus CBS 121060]